MESKVRVIVRIRPFLNGEDPSSRCAHISKSEVLELTSTVQTARYKFDACYKEDAEQSNIFAEVSDSIGDVLKGLNTTIFAYGMTGAGKTHTMQGTADDPGIIPRVAQHLIQTIDACASAGDQYEIRLSYLEIYNEKVFDLLDPKEEDLTIRQDARGEIVIPGLCTERVGSYAQFERVYQKGCNNRTTAPTGLNGNSSRSHAILCIYVQHKQVDKVITGKIHLIDLAGSEDNRYTKNTGVRMTESSSINTSLFVLGKVVNALNDGARVPYRDSKLTRLLQDSLGGNSNAIMIANIAPCQHFFSETQRTLNFASKSRKIVNKPTVHAETIQRAAEVDPAEERRRKLEEWRRQKGKATSRKPVASSADKENTSEHSPLATMLNRMQLSDTPPNKLEELFNRMSSLLGNEGNLEDRLQRIEQALKEKESSEGSIGAPLPKDISSVFASSRSSDPNSTLGLLTPSTKERTAKGFLLAGKEQEQRGQIHNALALYENAFRLLPEKNARLAAKIKKLTELTGGGRAVAPIPLQPLPSEPLTPEQIETRTRQVLDLINTGSVKQLSQLHMIADKRAKLLIAHRPFTSIQDMEKVHGVGRRFVEKFYALNVTGTNDE